MAIYIFMQGTMIAKEIHPVLQNVIISKHDKHHFLLVITALLNCIQWANFKETTSSTRIHCSSRYFKINSIKRRVQLYKRYGIKLYIIYRFIVLYTLLGLYGSTLRALTCGGTGWELAHVDLQGGGRSSLPPPPPANWQPVTLCAQYCLTPFRSYYYLRYARYVYKRGRRSTVPCREMTRAGFCLSC